MPMFPVKRYLGDDKHTEENDEGIAKQNLNILLSKIKQRSERQQKPPNSTSLKHEKHFKSQRSTKKHIQIADEIPPDSKKNKLDDDDNNDDLSAEIERLQVEDDSTHSENNVPNLVDEEVDRNTNEVFPVIGNITFKKRVKVKRFLPEWLANPSVVSVDLKHLDTSIHDIPELHSVFINTLQENNITHFFPVQAQVIPWLLKTASQPSLLPPGDVCVSAPTGSGKTLAYGIPILQALMGCRVGQIQALVVLPVQDLATQVSSVLNSYSDSTGLKVHLSSGALSLIEDRTHLLRHRKCVGWESLADILVVTPGRLVEHLNTTQGFTLKYLRFIVIDEADRVIDSQQNNWLHHLDQHLSIQSNQLLTVQNMRTAPRRPQKLLFSATLSSDPEKLNHLHLFQPRLFTSIVETIKSQGEFVGQLSTPAELKQCMVRCVMTVKPLVLYHLVTRPGWSRVLVFVSSSRAGHQLTALLTLLSEYTKRTLNIAEISAECSPKHRESLLTDFGTGKIDVLISTDQLARGMDIPDVQYVVSYDMPKYVKAYIHRVGRTGRAGQEGLAVTMVTHKQVPMFHQMLQDTGILESISELNVDQKDLKALEEPFRESLKKLKIETEKEEVKNVAILKLAKRGYPMKMTPKRKQKKDTNKAVKRFKK